MSDVRIIVDHLKLEYKGIFDINNFFRLVDSFYFERGLEKRDNKTYEHNTPKGKFIEWENYTWKKISAEYIREMIKMRTLMYELKKIDVVKDDDTKAKLMHGRVLIYLDGYLETDYEHRWDETPFFIFLRTLYDKFLYKVYTERFEQRITYDCHQLYELIERFFNMHRHYRPVSKVPLFG